jgi:DNA-binding transcriptional ArsR family regulator
MFISKHALVLSLVAKNPRITAQELATAIGMTERQVRRVIADLYDSGYISKKRIGRGMKYGINPDLSLRHDTHAEIAIGDFLEALGWKGRRKRRAISKNDGAQAEA